MICAKCGVNLTGKAKCWAKSPKDGKMYLVCDGCFNKVVGLGKENPVKWKEK